MIRASRRRSHVDNAGWRLALALALAGCSAPATSGGVGEGTTSSWGGSNSPTTERASARSSSTNGAATNSVSRGSTSSSSDNPASVIPSAEGFTTGPPGATDLATPPVGEGIQFVTPAGAFTVFPGQEIFPDYCVVTSSEIQIGGFQSWMTQGSSHHVILYNGGTVAAGTADGVCSVGGHNWMYATSTPGQVVTENFPPNVGLDLPVNTQLVLNMHFVNAGSQASSPQVKLNLLTAKNVMYPAGTMVAFNTHIDVPAASAFGPGTQTVSGTCTVPAGSNFFSMSTHTHKRATVASILYVHDGQSTEVVHTGTTSNYPPDQEPGSGTDWQHPGIGVWASPSFLTMKAGDTFQYGCSYTNNESTPVSVGDTTNDEMCVAIGYYFPAGDASCQ